MEKKITVTKQELIDAYIKWNKEFLKKPDEYKDMLTTEEDLESFSTGQAKHLIELLGK